MLLAIALAGALVRQYFVLRQQGRNPVLLPAGAAAVVALLAFVLAPKPGPALAEAPAFAEVHAITTARCTSCHAARPTLEGFAAPPKGVVLETPEQIRRWAASMRQQVATEAMPPGNMTDMTPEERSRMLAWIAAGARTN